MYICAKGTDFAYVSTILQLDFETIFYNAVFFYFILLHRNYVCDIQKCIYKEVVNGVLLC